MVSRMDTNKKRIKRHQRVRKKIFGTAQKPRLCVFRSLQNIRAQVIDDEKGVTLVSASSLGKEFTQYGGNKQAARLVGQAVAKAALEKGITEVVFDRGGYIFHGRVRELAEGARDAGLKF